MSYSVVIQDDARLDLQAAYRYYEDEQVGLGQQLILAFKEKILLLADRPFICQKIYKNRRRAILEPFKYNILYEVDEAAEVIYVEAVMHSSSDPKRWKKR